MAYSPISNTVPQYHVDGVPASGYVLKAYIAATSTLLQMATAADGLTLVNTVSLNSQGYPAVSGNTIIPHLNAAYKLALYPTQAAADANSGAIWTIDNLAPSSIISNISFSGNTITSTNTNGDITLDPNGSGEINLNATTNITTADIQALQVGSVAVTSSAAELNILDGVTSTAAELNKTDDSAAAVASYVSAMRNYVHVNGANATSFNVVGNVTESTFESVGPTGSGATNIWTALDDLPVAATIARLSVYTTIQPDGTDRLTGIAIYARQTGSATAAGELTQIHFHQFLVDDFTTGTPSSVSIAEVPLDSSRRFDITWAASSDATRSCELKLKGFMV